jgi:ribosome recycling factor
MDSLIRPFADEARTALAFLKDEFAGIRANRPSAQLIDHIHIDYFGSMVPLKQIGSISVAPPSEIVIALWDKAMTPSVAKAIEAANTGMSITADSSSIRLRLPALTDERRAELVRLVKATAEKARIRIRAIREDANKAVKTSGMNEDVQFALKNEVQKFVDAANEEIERMVAAKSEEIRD